ncbi:MAG: hypothetical protein IT562_20395 [Alphaproteobacteria bacterium]|nr:hypothetical protein [Alphaproteobacteria bacterium]
MTRQTPWAAAMAASMLLMLAPAVWNGFPLMFYDTGAFIDQALTGKFVAERAVAYAWFLKLTGPTYSLWPVVIVQALITALTMRECARVLAPTLSPGRLVAIVLALCVGTGLPWYVGQVLPDFLTAPMALALYLLGLHADAISLPRKLALLAMCVLAVAAHAAHLLLAGGLAACIAAFQLARTWRPSWCPAMRPRWHWPALSVALALVFLLASNFVRTGEVFISRAGPAFVFGRLVQDGIVKRLLDETCPGAGYGLCAYKDTLPANANDWLWGPATPFWELGGFEGTAAESARIIADSLRRYPLMHLRTAAEATVEQFFTFRTGDGIEAQPWPTWWAMETFLPAQLPAYVAARQQKNEIDFTVVNWLQVPIGLASMAAAVAVVAVSLRRRRCDDRSLLPGFLLLALLGNAFICGALSNPHDRYQSRLLWAVPFALLLLASRSAQRRA